MRREIVYFIALALLLMSCDRRQQLYSPQTFDDLKGHTVCVLEGSFQQSYAMERQKKYGYKLLFLPSATDCMLAMRNHKADVVFGAEMYSFNSAFHRNHLKVCHVLSDIYAPVAFGLKKDNTTMTADINAFEDSLTRCGAMKEIIDRWFVIARQGCSDFHNCIKIPTTAGVPDNNTKNPKKVLRVGVSGMIPPAEVLIENKWTGCEIELLQRYALSRGLQLQVDCYDFNNLIPALKSGKIDIIAAALAVNEERQQKIAFTKPYTDLFAAFITLDQNDATSNKDDGNSVSSLFLNICSDIEQGIYYSLIAENRWKMLVDGLVTTLIISILSLFLGCLIGAVICWLRMYGSRPLRITGRLYISIMRNIPMLVFLMMMFYVFLADTGLSAVTVAIIAFGMNSAAYIAEIYRTGIKSVDRGQTEAGLALGFSPLQTFFYIVAPQAAHKARPVCKNEVVTMLKGTSIVGYISIIDLTKASDLIRSSSFEAFFPLLIVTLAYFILSWLFTTLIDKIIDRI